MSAAWNWVAGVAIVCCVVAAIVCLAFVALADGDDWDDDKGKGA